MIRLPASLHHREINFEPSPGLRQHLEMLLLNRVAPSPFRDGENWVDSAFSSENFLQFSSRNATGWLLAHEIAEILEQLPGEQNIDFKRVGDMVRIGDKVYYRNIMFNRDETVALLSLFEQESK